MLELLPGFVRKYVLKGVRKSIRRIFDYFSPRHPIFLCHEVGAILRKLSFFTQKVLRKYN